MVWSIEIGQTLKRRDVHALYGGQREGGISTPVNSNHILIFTDPKSGAQYGYDKHEGLREDGSYAYTGQGQVGDQKFIRGNKAILDSAQNGKTIRLFKVDKTLVTYVGAFTIGDPSHLVKDALDVNGDVRNVLIFNLVPVVADIELLPTYGGTQTLRTSVISDWRAPEWTSYEISQAAKSETTLQASRIEFELQSAFGNWLLSCGDEVRTLTIKIGSATIFPDLFNGTKNQIIEAKKSASRGHVREAIGQVLDYQNNERLAGNERKCAILLPGSPASDLIELCRHLEIELYVPNNPENLLEGFGLIDSQI